MARGELMKKLLASYGRDDEFRAVAEQIIDEEEKKNNRVLARSSAQDSRDRPEPAELGRRRLRPCFRSPKQPPTSSSGLSHATARNDIVLGATNVRVLLGLVKEFRRADEIRRHGLKVRSKLLFCGPPGCGKTLCAEIFAAELGLPLFLVKLDRLISSYLGETAGNVRKIFEFARKQPCVLFFDEFDAYRRARVTTTASTMSCAGSSTACCCSSIISSRRAF